MRTLLSSHNFDIFTTNYDTCIERYFNIVKYEKGLDVEPLNEGMSEDGIHWSPDNFSDLKRNRLFKLHGSVEFYWTSSGITRTPSKLSAVRGETIKGELMIYPVKGKHPYGFPFWDMLVYLREALLMASKIIVTGYSFRDQVISNIFFSAIRQRSKLTYRTLPKELIVVSPNASEMAEKNLKEVRDKVAFIDARFGESKFYDELSKVMTNV